MMSTGNFDDFLDVFDGRIETLEKAQLNHHIHIFLKACQRILAGSDAVVLNEILKSIIQKSIQF